LPYKNKFTKIKTNKSKIMHIPAKNHRKSIKKLQSFIFLTQILCSAFYPFLSARAQAVIEAQPAYPYQKTFTISAYYSPLPDQKKYVTGSYESDIRLNGRGTNGADGTQVYPGMVAAPKSYKFGTKLKIPGIGLVAVHDRGGAIVEAGEKNQAYDRLDIWMGHGDAGLQRALNWGRRTMEVTVFGIDPSLKEQVNLEGYSQAEKYVQQKIQKEAEIFSDDLYLNTKGPGVEKLQNSLKSLGYYSGTPSKVYDATTIKSLIRFQIDSGIIDTRDDFGAGYFGPQTRKVLASQVEKRQQQVKNHLPQTGLGKEDQGEEVKKLQQKLKQLGYKVEVNGIYDEKTIDAVFKFQYENEILKSKNEVGAGFFGPKTSGLLASKLEGPVQPQVAVPLFQHDLKLGDSGDEVIKLQRELKKVNLLGVEPSGNYGEVTAHAVFKLQQNFGLVLDKNSPYAGKFGPVTRARFNELITKRGETEQLIIKN
jgi:peptidoglycan hydrolase-like protein with peptidoglycan-binding domain/3D (Asp-Asp-Asp) domain-containing protein